jgi:zinc protease
MKRVLMLLASLAVATSLSAQRLAIESYTLPNGLRVVLNEDHSAPLVAVNIWYHVGSKDETPGQTGFAHLFEHMLFSGSEHLGPYEYARRIESVGGTRNGSTAFDRTNYYATVPSRQLPMVLWLESDRMGFFLPAIDQKNLDVQKQVVKEERRQRYDNVPYGTAFEDLLRLAYPSGHPYSWPTIGSMEDLTAAKLDEVTDFFKRWYMPNNAVLSIVGDFDPAVAKELVERYFGSIPRGEQPTRATIAPVTLAAEKRQVIHGQVPLPRIARLYHIPKFGSDEWIAVDLLSHILTNGKASRLEKSLVYERQLAKDIDGFVYPSEAVGIFLLNVTTPPNGNAGKTEAALDVELNRVAKEGITEAELSRALNLAETDYANELSEFASRANLLSQMTTLFGDPKVATTLMDRYRAIDRDKIREVAATWLTSSNRVTIHYLPKNTKEEAAR